MAGLIAVVVSTFLLIFKVEVSIELLTIVSYICGNSCLVVTGTFGVAESKVLSKDYYDQLETMQQE